MLDIVGCDDSRFFSLEVKNPNATRGLTPRQEAIIDRIRKAGGIAGEVRSVRDALELLDE